MTDIVNELVAGDTLDFVTQVDGYPASDGWQLQYSLRGPSVINLTGAAEGAGYRVQASGTTTSSWLAGDYTYMVTVSKSGQRYTVGDGRLTIKPDLLQINSAGYDPRSVAEKALADAEAALASFTASKGKVKKYTIGSRSMEFATVPEILNVISYWKARVLTEQSAQSIANGLGDPRRLFVRFGR